MLRSVQDLVKLRVIAADGVSCGRIKDIYFDDRSWAIKYLVLALEPRQFGAKQVLLTPEQVTSRPAPALPLQLNLPAAELETLPFATSVLPVCKQYASIALASPGATLFGPNLTGANPHLRSARTVADYRINVASEYAGTLVDFLFDEEAWQIRFLAVEQVIECKKIHFHLLPQSVERFTWATQRVLLRHLEPVELAVEQLPAAAAA